MELSVREKSESPIICDNCGTKAMSLAWSEAHRNGWRRNKNECGVVCTWCLECRQEEWK